MRAPLLLCLVVAIGCHQTKDEQTDTDERVLTCKGDEPAPPPPTPGACREGWCWAHPFPQGLTLTTVWASGPDTAWMVGQNGTIVHAQGDALELMDTGTHAELTDIWGGSEQDVWAAGKGGTFLHWDGTHWQAVSATTQDLTSLTGSSANDVWAAGANGTLLHWNGVAWGQVALATSATFLDLASAGPDTVWATTGGHLLRCTPAGCDTVSADLTIGGQYYYLQELLSFSLDEVYALSTDLLHWKDGAWEILAKSNGARSSSSEVHLAGSGPQDLWVSDLYPGLYNTTPYQLMYHYGTTSAGPAAPSDLVGFTRKQLPIRGMAAPSPGHLYVVTSRAQVFRLADDQWRSLMVNPPFRITPDFSTVRSIGRNEIITDVTALPTGEVGVAALGGLPSWGHIRLFSDSAGNTWTAMAWRPDTWFRGDIFVPTETLVLEIWRVGADGTREVVHRSAKSFDGDTSKFGDYAPSIVGIHGSSEHNVWVVSASDVLHWDGTAWTPVLQLDPKNAQSEFTGAVWTTGPQAAWIGLTHGLLAWDGKKFETVEFPDTWVNGLWASSSRDVWAVGWRGSQPVAYHFDGKKWSEVPLPAEAEGIPLVDVVGRCESDVYLVGGGNVLLHWDGAQWTVVPMPVGMGVSRAAKIGSELWLVGAPSPRVTWEANGLVRHAW